MELIPLSYPLTAVPHQLADRSLSIAIGHFDGVHRGHQNVINLAAAVARDNGLSSAVMTFSPHPKEVLGHGDQYFSCLTPLSKKTELFRKLDVDIVFVVQFDLAFAAVSPSMFVEEVLKPLGVSRAVVGFDFTFGHRGSGNAEMLQSLGGADMSVHIVEPLYEDGMKVSSTLTREALERGDLETAIKLLGRPYEISGTVVHGDGRGRTIGYPTANLDLDGPYVSPRMGVYAVKVDVDGVVYDGVLNYGMKPTFKTGQIQPVMEAHLFDMSADIYGKTIHVQFLHFIRSERKFSSVDELIAQIKADSEQARTQLRGQQGK